MIFKSQQVNLDPEPYLREGGRRFRLNWQSAGLILAPRPEFEPTRDPYPWLDKQTRNRYSAPGKRLSSNKPWVYAPRREQFDTPVNPLLARLRVIHGRKGFDYRTFLESLTGVDAWQWLDFASAAQVDHAVRVITRLVARAEVNK